MSGNIVMVVLSVQGALVSRFQDHQPETSSGLDLSAFIQTRHNPIDVTDEGNKREIQVLVGMGDINEIGGALRGANAVATQFEIQRKEEKERKEAAKRRQLQALLDQLAELDAQIAEIDKKIGVLEDKIDALNDAITGLQDGSGACSWGTEIPAEAGTSTG